MCSIIGYCTNKQVSETLVDALQRMEYRGYDSVGIATNHNNAISLKKDVGNVASVSKKLNLHSLRGEVGIGHTRWATHGGVNEVNAHPHLCADNSIAVVHNGIIENYLELKEELQHKYNIKIKSETDTEVIPNLLSVYYKQTNDIKKAMILTLKRLKGNYAFVAMFLDGTIAAAKNHEPLILGLEENGNGYFVSSDILGFLEHTRDVVYLEDEQFVVIKPNSIQVFDFKGNSARYNVETIPVQLAPPTKEKYAHFTLKEIAEQSSTILATSKMATKEIKDSTNLLKKFQDIYMCGSGTSYHAALIAQRLFPIFTHKRVEPIVASDVKFSHDRIFSDSVFIAISQSGESADVLESVSIAKSKGVPIISIVNATTSSLAKISDFVIPLNCGVEVGVAATKSYTSQLVILYKIIEELSELKLVDFDIIADAARNIFSTRSKIQSIAKKLKNQHSLFILGRGIHYPIAKEGALKIKEITYIHTEAIATGELKHGPLALMDENSYVIIINPKDNMHKDNLNNINEVKARNAKVIVISDEPNDIYDDFIQIPKVNFNLYPLVEIIPLQMLAYYLAIEKGINPDYPRNLAKSVTVK